MRKRETDRQTEAKRARVRAEKARLQKESRGEIRGKRGRAENSYNGLENNQVSILVGYQVGRAFTDAKASKVLWEPRAPAGSKPSKYRRQKWVHVGLQTA